MMLWLEFVLLVYCKICHGAYFEKIVPPLHTDLENSLMTTMWTSSAMQCALRCAITTGCLSFMYTNKGKVFITMLFEYGHYACSLDTNM